jgi:hypothetical protein
MREVIVLAALADEDEGSGEGSDEEDINNSEREETIEESGEESGEGSGEGIDVNEVKAAFDRFTDFADKLKEDVGRACFRPPPPPPGSEERKRRGPPPPGAFMDILMCKAAEIGLFNLPYVSCPDILPTLPARCDVTADMIEQFINDAKESEEEYIEDREVEITVKELLRLITRKSRHI